MRKTVTQNGIAQQSKVEIKRPNIWGYEANALYEDMTERLKASGLEKLAQEQVDGIVRRSEEGAEFFVESTVPSVCKDRINAHDGGCASIMFEYNSVGGRIDLLKFGILALDH